MNDGFFSAVEIADMAPKTVRGRVFSCRDCKLDQECKTPRMKCGGKGRKGIMVIGDAPGENEDEKGSQFVGRAGKEVEWYLSKLGISFYEDCWTENACCCRPVKNDTPTATQILACRERLFKSIRTKQPKVIILLGKSAVDSVIGKYWGSDIGPVGRWRGFRIPCHDLTAWLCPTFHPSYILREKNQESAAPIIFGQDLRSSLSCLENPLPEPPSEKHIQPLDDFHAIRHMRQLLEAPPRLLAFDYETTGLKPHAKGHEIVCCSLCSDPHKAVTFWMENEMVQKTLCRVLESDIPKVASNLKYEDQWSRHILGVHPRNWKFDTMLAAHVQDNRQLITSIKFQGYVRLGVAGYENRVKPYLETGSKNANSINRLKEVRGWKDVLVYCGMDSLLEYRVASMQMKELGIE